MQMYFRLMAVGCSPKELKQKLLTTLYMCVAHYNVMKTKYI